MSDQMRRRGFLKAAGGLAAGLSLPGAARGVQAAGPPPPAAGPADCHTTVFGGYLCDGYVFGESHEFTVFRDGTWSSRVRVVAGGGPDGLRATSEVWVRSRSNPAEAWRLPVWSQTLAACGPAGAMTAAGRDPRLAAAFDAIVAGEVRINPHLACVRAGSAVG